MNKEQLTKENEELLIKNKSLEEQIKEQLTCLKEAQLLLGAMHYPSTHEKVLADSKKILSKYGY